MTDTLLEVRHLGKQFGGLRALDDVSLAVHPQEIKAIIGPNGAGKTTLFNCITGIERITTGSIYFDKRPITGLPPHRIAACGIARTWQTIRLFEDMTVLENVMVGRHCRSRCGLLRSALRTPAQRREERQLRSDAFCQLEFLGIAALADRRVGELPFLQQRRVELARALAAEPRLLCLDEPAAGLNVRETAELGEVIRTVRNMGMTVLLVEHDMALVMDISDSVLVLDHGFRIAEGTPQEIQRNEQVISVYLGSGAL